MASGEIGQLTLNAVRPVTRGYAQENENVTHHLHHLEENLAQEMIPKLNFAM